MANAMADFFCVEALLRELGVTISALSKYPQIQFFMPYKTH
jgi:hypothetical protein